jgi:hypothetical protein
MRGYSGESSADSRDLIGFSELRFGRIEALAVRKV